MALAGKELDPWQRDAIDLMLSYRADGKWACFEYCEWVARQNGKGAILEARALAGLFLLGEELIMWSAHEYKTAMEAFRRVKVLVNKLIEKGVIAASLIKINNTNGEESFERLDTGQRIKFIARSKGSGRGFSGDVNIIDETFAYTDIQQEALMPTMSARDNAQIVYTSTPPLTGDTGGPMYELKARAERGGDDSLGYRDWGLAGNLESLRTSLDLLREDDERTNVDDVELWAATNPALGHRITMETITRLRRGMGVTGFAREVLGIWPLRLETGSDLLAALLTAWPSLADSRSHLGLTLALAVDAPPDRRSAAIACVGRRDDGRLHVQVIEYKPGMGWVVDTLAELVKEYEPVATMLDPSGPAGSLLADLDEKGVDIDLVSGRDMAQACGAFFDDCVNDRLRHIDQSSLSQALSDAATRPLGDAWAWSRKDSAGDVSPLVAATLAAHGFRLHGGNSEPWAVIV